MEGRAFEKIWYPLMRKLGYDGSFIQKGKPNYWAERDDTALIDGVSIFYDTNKFALLECKKFGISDYYNTEFENWYGVDFNHKEISTIFNTRNQVGLIVVLQHYMTNETIIVLNTHLYWKLSDVKLLQTIVLLEALHKIKLKYTNSRVLFTGDFNSRPNSSVYEFLKNDKIESSNKDISQYLSGSNKEYIANPVETSSNIFDTIIQQDDLFTCYTQHLFGIFDYIWFNSTDFNLVGFLSGVDRDYLKVIQGLPNRDFPSDHIPLVAEFEIVK
jgi:mRNA deadenylase 3'-5' endonuclease subunit Ccr4